MKLIPLFATVAIVCSAPSATAQFMAQFDTSRDSRHQHPHHSRPMMDDRHHRPRHDRSAEEHQRHESRPRQDAPFNTAPRKREHRYHEHYPEFQPGPPLWQQRRNDMSRGGYRDGPPMWQQHRGQPYQRPSWRE
ncbi:MAG: hypothetical protein U5S82_23635 [Gammaproteobacteria bacterium]|nr:hypothetical protein [Gammaproteobacteria bacterium]